MKGNLSFKVDSLLFVLPVDELLKAGIFKVKLPEKLIMVDNDSGETLNELTGRKGFQFLKSDDLRLHDADRYYVAIRKLRLRNVHRTYLTIAVSSKNSNVYFEGVTENTLIDVLIDLKSKGYVEFDIENIEKIIDYVEVTDVDVAIDFLVPKKIDFSYDDIWNFLFSFYKLSKEIYPNKKVKKFDKKDNKGVEFSDEGGRKGRYYFKFYEKLKELGNKHENVNSIRTTLFDVYRNILRPHLKLFRENYVIRFEISFLNRNDLYFFDVPIKFLDLLKDVQNNKNKYLDILRRKLEYFTVMKHRKKYINELMLTSQKMNIAASYIPYLMMAQDFIQLAKNEIKNEKLKQEFIDKANFYIEEFVNLSIKTIMKYTKVKNKTKLKSDKKKLFNEVKTIVDNNLSEMSEDLKKIKNDIEKEREIFNYFNSQLNGIFNNIFENLRQLE